MSTTYGEAAALVTGQARARVSWSAIFAGVVLAVAVQLLLSILGAGVGLGFVNPGHADSASAATLGLGAGIWWMVSMIISLIVGGYIAARMAGVDTRLDGLLHGLVVWGLAMMLTIYLLTSAVGGVIGGAFSAVAGTVSAAGSVIGSTASAVGGGVKDIGPQAARIAGISPNALQQRAQDLLQSSTPQDPASMSPADATKAIAQEMPNLVAGGQKGSAAKQRITDIIAAQAHISPQDAQKRVDNAVAQFNQDKEQAIATAKNAADASAAAASHASFLTFLGLLIGAIAGAVGGVIATPREVFGSGRRIR
jgi:hypothetical protein